jgi:signal peptidase I
MSKWRRARRDVISILLCIAAVFTARSSLADHYYVPSGSMMPTVHVDDRVLVDKLAYGVRVPIAGVYAIHFSPPARGDVVVLTSPENHDTLLKRVVAVPGDRVRVTDGQLELNGSIVKIEPDGQGLIEQLGSQGHPLDLEFGGGPVFGPVTVPNGRYLVLGDNRGNSHDGRMFGFVDEDAIMGRASGVFYRDGKMTWIGL